MDNNEKHNQTEINLTINTGGHHNKGNYIEERRQQIEKAGMYIEALFGAIELMADCEIDLESRTVHNIQCLSEIGRAFSNFITYDNNLVFYDAEKELQQKLDNETDTAQKIKSDVLDSPVIQ